jgi:hypothetical protein
VFANWGLNQPNDLGGQDCVAVVLTAITGLALGDWYDEVCDDALPYVCDTNALPAGCSLELVGGRARAFCNTPLSWTAARDACAAAGGQLIRFVDPADDAAVWARADVLLSGAGFWIGADDRAVEGEIRWLDGEEIPWVYSNWDVPDSPNDFQGNEDCLELQVVADLFTGAGQWNDADCATSRHYSCDAVSPGVSVPAVCDHYDGADGVHRVLCEELLGWDAALAACQALGGTLSGVDSAAGNDALRAGVSALFATPDDIWLGGRDAVEGLWTWTDGTVLDDVR